jgi:hypothetical protein
VAIVVSESSVVRVFYDGHIEATLLPELWLLDRHHSQLGLGDNQVATRPGGAR